MRISQENNNIIINEVTDFDISQTMECGQCFHFNKLREKEYGIVSGERFLHIRQEENKLICYDTTVEEVESYWIEYFDLRRDYAAIKSELIRNDKRLEKVIADKYGVRILNQEFHETLMSFIISQNKQIPHIKQIVNTISEKYGSKLANINGIEFYSFPNVDLLGKITEEEYRECKSGFRAKYLHDASIKLNDGTIKRQMFESASFEEAKNKLMEIKGVGEKVANCVLLFSLGYREAFPVDVWIKRIMETLYFEKEVSKEEIAAFAKEKYGDYGGYAQQYLFYYGREHQIGK